MCGLAGFSLRSDSKVNARELAHHLLHEITNRGNMASGFAFVADDVVGVYKNAVAGTQLKLKGLPREARTVIMHTRLATHGSIMDNRNNHPVMSPNGKIALTHNGVIWNHDTVRFLNLDDYESDMPDVDTAVLPALIQVYGISGMKNVSGDAAIAWLEEGAGEILNVARIEHSPVSYTWLLDGSFVYASTEALLIEALNRANLEFGAVFSMVEREWFTVENGVISNCYEVPESAVSGNGAWTYRGMTSGASNTPSAGGFKGIGSSFGSKASEDTPSSTMVNRYNAETDEWEFTPVYPNSYDIDDDDNYEKSMALVDIAEDALDLGATKFRADNFSVRDEFYTISHDGDFKSYETLEDLEAELKYMAGLHEGDDHFGADGLSRWVESYTDVGSMDVTGAHLTSWVDNPSEILYYENHSQEESLGYVKDGASILRGYQGA